MVLHLQEFTSQYSVKGEKLNYYDALPEYLHEMTVDDILQHINRNGARSSYLQQNAIISYFQWLNKTYNVDVSDKNYELSKALKRDNKRFIGFYTLKELKQGIEEALQTIEATAESERDYDGLLAIFYLEWLGVLPKASIGIKLTDVSNDGKTVYIPSEKRTIEVIDDYVADFFVTYKRKTGFKRYKNSDKEDPYMQNTFYRNTFRRGDGEISEKTIYNIRLLFINESGDDRFAKRRIYYSGRYAEMFRKETELSYEFSAADAQSCEIIRKIYNDELTYVQISTILREYAVFKQSYLQQL